MCVPVFYCVYLYMIIALYIVCICIGWPCVCVSVYDYTCVHSLYLYMITRVYIVCICIRVQICVSDRDKRVYTIACGCCPSHYKCRITR